MSLLIKNIQMPESCLDCDANIENDGKYVIGHWIFVHPLQENDPGAYICSECKTGDWDINPVKDKVCKFCGAKMERE